jgi:hypothetical protein
VVAATAPITYDSGTQTVGFDRTLPMDSITYAATVTLDMAALNGLYRTINLTGPLTLASSNRATGRSVVLRLVCDATTRALTFPSGWRFLERAPTQLIASQVAILTVTFYGSTDADAVCTYALQSAVAPLTLWTPSSLGAALRLWYDAADAATITASGSPLRVSAWNDKSGNNHHLVQATASYQPQYQATGLLGKGAVVSDLTSTGDRLMATSGTVPFTGTGVSMFGVGVPTNASGPSGWQLAYLLRSNTGSEFLYYANTYFAIANKTLDMMPIARPVPGWDYNETQAIVGWIKPAIFESIIDSSSVHSFYWNGDPQLVSKRGTFSTFTVSVRLFDFLWAWGGPVGEIIVTTTALSDSDRRKVEGYLAHKWWGPGLANELPYGHPWKDTPPTV